MGWGGSQQHISILCFHIRIQAKEIFPFAYITCWVSATQKDNSNIGRTLKQCLWLNLKKAECCGNTGLDFQVPSWAAATQFLCPPQQCWSSRVCQGAQACQPRSLSPAVTLPPTWRGDTNFTPNNNIVALQGKKEPQNCFIMQTVLSHSLPL